jgi:hypothetical protein
MEAGSMLGSKHGGRGPRAHASLPPVTPQFWSYGACRGSVRSASVGGKAVTFSWNANTDTFKLPSLNLQHGDVPAEGLDVCFELVKGSKCPSLDTFCYQYPSSKGYCVYSLFNDAVNSRRNACCPGGGFPRA